MTPEQYQSLEHCLYRLAVDIYSVNVDNGWFEDDRPFSADIALLHSEVSEAYEAYRNGGIADATVGAKPEGVGSELADILIRLMDTCYRYDINLALEVHRKLAYNATRGHKHGGKVE